MTMMSSTLVLAVGDSSSTRTVNRIIGGLVLLGVAMLVATIWAWRATRPIDQRLEGLDLITKRRWLKAAPDDRSALLQTVRDQRGSTPAARLIGPSTPAVSANAGTVSNPETTSRDVALVAAGDGAPPTTSPEDKVDPGPTASGPLSWAEALAGRAALEAPVLRENDNAVLPSPTNEVVPLATPPTPLPPPPGQTSALAGSYGEEHG